MVEGKRVAVVVPAFEEEHLVAETLRGIPDFVDRIYVVDDASSDGTAAAARDVGDARVELIIHERNGGVGAAIVSGYVRARAERIDVTCVMAGDNQMDPVELADLVHPVARGEVDYTKANRLITGEAWTLIPHTRYLGNAALSLLTKIASGYWHVADSQAGYTALSLAALDRLDLERVYRRYGFPNDMLVHLNVISASVRDIPSRPIYGVGERSGIRIHNVAPRIAWLLFKGFWWRMKEKYVIRDFHPLVFFYALGALMTAARLRPRARRRLLADLLRQCDHDADDRARGAPSHLWHAVHAVRDVVRPGSKQGAALKMGSAFKQPDESWPGVQRRHPSATSATWVVRSSLARWLRSEAERLRTSDTTVRVLDVGCGVKPYLPFFASVASEYVGVDVVETPEADVVGFVEDLPLDDGIFDLVLCTQVLEHCEDPAKAVKELRRVTAPGGRVLASTHGVQVYHPSPHDYWRWTHEGLAKLFADNGDWESVRVEAAAGTASTMGMLLATYVEIAMKRAHVARLAAGPVWVLNRTGAILDRRVGMLRDPIPGALLANFHVTAEVAGGS